MVICATRLCSLNQVTEEIIVNETRTMICPAPDVHADMYNVWEYQDPDAGRD